MKLQTKKFLSYYKPYLGLFWAILGCAFLSAAITLVLPLGIRYITKDILEGSSPDALRQIYQVGALMVALVGVQTVAGFFVDYHGHALGARMERDIRGELFEHYQRLPFRFYDNQKTGQLMSRITNDLLSLAELYHHGPEDYLIYGVKFIGALVILFHINVPLTLVILVFLPLMSVFTYFISKRMRAALRRNKERIGDINAQVEDSLSGIRVVKSFANEVIERDKFAIANNRFLESRKEGYKSEAYFSEGINLFAQLILIAVVVAGSASILNANLDLADLIVFLIYIAYLIEPIQKMSHMIQQFQEGITGFERFQEMIAEAPEIQDSTNTVELMNVAGNVEFKNVAFRYRDFHTDVLRNLTLSVKAGETIALVGSSGVGKTTLCSLIPRFYEVSEGEILLDGVSIKEISLQSLRRNVGVVQQDVYLFGGTVVENIRYGKPGASMEEIVAAAKKANAHDFIMALPEGYETDIGQRGVKLSGGQKQRLSIARVFLKDPPVLIFDEATSALDSESERVVQDSLGLLARGRTTFIIAHRLSTIRSAQRIVVLSGQGVDEQGTHAELLAKNGIYTRLYNLQFDEPFAVAGLEKA